MRRLPVPAGRSLQVNDGLGLGGGVAARVRLVLPKTGRLADGGNSLDAIVAHLHEYAVSVDTHSIQESTTLPEYSILF